MAKLYIYVLAVSHLKPEASLTTFVTTLRDSGIEVVDYDEETRRVVHRVPAAKLFFAKGLWDRLADSTTIEFKASAPAKRVKPSQLRRVFEQVDETPAAILFAAKCGDKHAVLGELRGRRLYLKLCRPELVKQPVTQYPPSICVYIYPGVDPVEMLEEARTCFEQVYSRILELVKSGESA